MRKIVYLCCLAVLASAFSLGGCNWAGRTAGKTKAKIERKVESVEQGYKEGYEDEKSKSESIDS